MSNPTENGTDRYTQDDRVTGAGDEFVSEPAAGGGTVIVKKKGSTGIKIVMLVMATVMVLAVGLFALGAMRKAKTPVAPAPVAAAPAPAAAAPAPQPAALPADPNALPATALPSGQPVAAVNPAAVHGATDPLTGLPITQAPAAGTPPVTPTDLGPSATDPATGLPLAAAVDPATGLPAAPAPGAPAPVAQAPGAPAPAPVVQAPIQSPSPAPATAMDPANNEGTSAIAQVRNDIMAGLDKIQASMTSMDQRVTTRMDDFDRRLASLEGRPAGSLPKHVSSSQSVDSTPRVHHSKPRTRMLARSQPRINRYSPRIISSPSNRVEIITRADAPVQQMAIMVAPSQQASVSCHISAIQPGRFWIKRDDGSFVTFGVDDRAPNGGRITRVDPEAGVYVDGARWDCAR
jgi:hypothetical protein